MEEKEIYWSRFAKDFEKNNNYVVGKSDMDLVLNEVSKQKELNNTLELACGSGMYSRVLSKISSKLTATDFSDEMLKVAENNLTKFENTTVEKANAFDLKYSDNSFDTVFLANLLHIISKPIGIIEEVKRVLKSDGRIIILDFGNEGMTFFNKIGMIFRFIKTYGKPPLEGTILSTKSIKDLLENSGFEVQNVKLIGKKSKAAFVIARKK